MPLLGRSRPSPAVAEEGRSSHDTPTDGRPLEVLNLGKRYQGGLWANRGISFTGNPGEILGILGPNGAGKTTLVRQITTELVPTEGAIKILGHDVVGEPDKVKALLGVVPQATSLFAYLTVHQHLRIFAKLRGIQPKEAKHRADQLIVDLDLSDHRNVMIEKLSGGLARRVMVGIAAIAEPPVMVLDEPTTGLDPQSRRNLWAVLRGYRERGAFVLLTTHSMEEAEVLCDRVGILRGSRLLALDTVANLRADYGFQLKITYFPDGLKMDGVTLYGADDQELVAKVRDMGYQKFSVGQTSLEDIYLAMTGGAEGFNDDAF